MHPEHEEIIIRERLEESIAFCISIGKLTNGKVNMVHVDGYGNRSADISVQPITTVEEVKLDFVISQG